MLSHNIDAYHSTIHVGHRRLYDLVVDVLLPLKCIESNSDEFEESRQIVGRRRRDKNVRVAESECTANRKACKLSTQFCTISNVQLTKCC